MHIPSLIIMLATLITVPSVSAGSDPTVELGDTGPSMYKFITLQNIQVAVKTYGSHTNPPIIMLHGYMRSSLSFAPLIKQLSRDYFLVIPDLPFHGESYISATRRTALQSDPTEFFSLCDKLIGKLIRHFSLKNVTLLGHSMGGVIAASYALKHPEATARIVLLESTPTYDWKKAGSCKPDCGKILETEKAIAFLNKVSHGKKIYGIIWTQYLKLDASPVFASNIPILWLMNTDQSIGEEHFVKLMQPASQGSSTTNLKTVSMKGHFIQWTATRDVLNNIRSFLGNKRSP